MLAATVARPRRRRSLERATMTPEEELELLVAEQQADDTHFIRKQLGEISYDGPAPRLDGNVEDYVGVDEDGAFVSFLVGAGESLFSVNVPHATFNAYNNLKCRCLKCRKFMTEYRRLRRAES